MSITYSQGSSLKTSQRPGLSQSPSRGADDQLSIPEHGSQMSPQMIVFGGAKGGVGRSSLCALVGLALAKRGQRTLLIDLNLGSANLHTLLGLMKPDYNLERWISKRDCALSSLICPTSTPHLSLISPASSILSIADLSPDCLTSLISEARQCEVDYLLFDIGPGLHPHHLDLINAASHSFCITTPDPLSIQNTYTLYKAALMRKVTHSSQDRSWLKKLMKRATLTQDDPRATSMVELLGMLRELDIDLHQKIRQLLKGFQLKLIINQALPEDESQVVKTLEKICETSLALQISHALTINEASEMRAATRKLKPLSHVLSDAHILREIDAWVDSWLLKQAYAPIRDDSLEMIGRPSLLSYRAQGSSNLSSDQLTPVPQMIAAQMSDHQRARFMSTDIDLPQGTPAQPVAYDDQERASYTQTDESASPAFTLKDVSARLYHDATSMSADSRDSRGDAQLQIQTDELSELREAMSQQALQSSSSFDTSPVDATFGSQSIEEAFIEPAPIHDVLMDDPPRHEVTAIEEEVKTPDGWCHLKTSDLAPFRPVIQTSIYRSGHREVFFEESYEAIYQPTSTEIEKRVERTHHENAQLLQERGLDGWRQHRGYV